MPQIYNNAQAQIAASKAQQAAGIKPFKPTVNPLMFASNKPSAGPSLGPPPAPVFAGAPMTSAPNMQAFSMQDVIGQAGNLILNPGAQYEIKLSDALTPGNKFYGTNVQMDNLGVPKSSVSSPQVIAQAVKNAVNPQGQGYGGYSQLFYKTPEQIINEQMQKAGPGFVNSQMYRDLQALNELQQQSQYQTTPGQVTSDVLPLKPIEGSVLQQEAIAQALGQNVPATGVSYVTPTAGMTPQQKIANNQALMKAALAGDQTAKNLLAQQAAAKFTYQQPVAPQAQTQSFNQPVTSPQTGGQPTAPSDLNSYEQALLAAMQISPEEQAAQAQLDALTSGLALGQAGIENQPIPLPLLVGQSAALEKQALAKSVPLQQKLAMAQAKRQAAFDVAKTKYGFAEKREERAYQEKQQEKQLALQEKKDLEKRRQDAISQYLDLRNKFAGMGVKISADAGNQFMQAFQTSLNPEAILDQYLVEAYKNPAVQAAIKPKGSGIGSAESIYLTPTTQTTQKLPGILGTLQGLAQKFTSQPKSLYQQFVEATGKEPTAAETNALKKYGQSYVQQKKAAQPFLKKEETSATVIKEYNQAKEQGLIDPGLSYTEYLELKKYGI